MDRRTRSTTANPLKRGADRTRTRLHVAFAVVCALAVVCGVMIGQSVWNHGSGAAEEIARHRHTAMATTTAGTRYVASSGVSGLPATEAAATWHYPANRAHTQTVPVPDGTRKGDAVRVWLDDNGDAAAAPPATVDIAASAIGYGTGALCGIVLAAGAVVFVRLRIVDAHSIKAWEAEWADIEPLWSGRLRPGRGTGDD
ncbi:hypothetical protein AB0451_06985 [Streptomyces sp. NPDC052000]|uniref:Rv1733c family protein n=1 Tax=Streptomyces sp. NPDC052000 TaxID=3155676 RepID=UPI00344F5AD7